MLPVMQVVTKNDLLKREASIFLEKMFIKYGVDIRTISYADLRPLFKNPFDFLVKRFDLKKVMSKEDFEMFQKLEGISKPVAKKPAPKPKPPTPPKPEPKSKTLDAKIENKIMDKATRTPAKAKSGDDKKE